MEILDALAAESEKASGRRRPDRPPRHRLIRFGEIVPALFSASKQDLRPCAVAAGALG